MSGVNECFVTLPIHITFSKAIYSKYASELQGYLFDTSLLSTVLVIDGMRRKKPTTGRQSPALHRMMAWDLLYASSHSLC